MCRCDIRCLSVLFTRIPKRYTESELHEILKINISPEYSSGIEMAVLAFAGYVAKAFGRNKSVISVATAAILALTSFFYIYTLGSYFKIGTSVLHEFYNYIGFFHSYVIGKYCRLLSLDFFTNNSFLRSKRTVLITILITKF